MSENVRGVFWLTLYYTVSQEHVTTFSTSTITLTISVRLQYYQKMVSFPTSPI